MAENGLAHTLFRVPREDGLHVLQRRGEHGARELTSRRLRLKPGGSARVMVPGEETVVVLQEGNGTFSAGDKSWQVSRAGVFTDRATALLLPPGVEMIVTADTQLEAVVVSTPAPEGGQPVLFGPDTVEVNARGRGIYSREVHDICVRDPHGRRLMVGETFNPPGHWSSFPPHKHDGRDGEPTLEEVYHFRLDPPQGFGQQMLYTNDGESVTHAVRDGDAVLLPYGYHPVCAAPGYKLYYLWAMAGQQRRLALHEDPAHRWIHEIDQEEAGRR
jgi:5-deoxy-glucuronate isomerase